MASIQHTPQSETVQSHVDETDSEPTSGSPQVVSLLDDEHAREILTCLASGPKRGRELATACACSRATIYRRLNGLESVGLVTASLSIDPDGHHCKQFRLVHDQVTVHISGGSLTVVVDAANSEISSME